MKLTTYNEVKYAFFKICILHYVCYMKNEVCFIYIFRSLRVIVKKEGSSGPLTYNRKEKGCLVLTLFWTPMTKAVRPFYNTHWGEGGAVSARTCSQIIQSATKFEVPVHKHNIHVKSCANFNLLGQKFRSLGQVRVSCLPRDKLQISRSYCRHSFSPNIVKLSG